MWPWQWLYLFRQLRDDVAALRTGQKSLIAKVNTIMATLDDVKNKVDAETTVVASAVTLLTDLKTKLDAAIASNDPTKLQALSDAIGAQTDALAAAVAANTPAAPTP